MLYKFRRLRLVLNKILNKRFEDILFFIEIILFRRLYVWLSLHPSSAPFLSGDTYKKLSTIEYKGGNIEITKPEIIFTSGNLIKELGERLIDSKESFILITHHGDISVDSSYKFLADNPRLVRWYAQNNEYPHHKIIPIPIGLEDRWRHNNGIVRDFSALRAKPTKKIPRILYGFTAATNEAERAPALAALRNTGVADEFVGSSRRYRKALSEYMFVASPPGNGVDCHRTWEALYLGTIPIVITRKFHAQFSDLPLLIIDSWFDLKNYSETDLEFIYEEQAKKLNSLKIIWSDFWRKSIESDFASIK